MPPAHAAMPSPAPIAPCRMSTPAAMHAASSDSSVLAASPMSRNVSGMLALDEKTHGRAKGAVRDLVDHPHVVWCDLDDGGAHGAGVRTTHVDAERRPVAPAV